jgi:hypothetical protein
VIVTSRPFLSKLDAASVVVEADASMHMPVSLFALVEGSSSRGVLSLPIVTVAFVVPEEDVQVVDDDDEDEERDDVDEETKSSRTVVEDEDDDDDDEDWDCAELSGIGGDGSCDCARVPLVECCCIIAVDIVAIVDLFSC